MKAVGLFRIVLCALVCAVASLFLSRQLPWTYIGMVRLQVVAPTEGRNDSIENTVKSLASPSNLRAAAARMKAKIPDTMPQDLAPQNLVEGLQIQTTRTTDGAVIEVRTQHRTRPLARAAAEAIGTAHLAMLERQEASRVAKLARPFEHQVREMRRLASETERQRDALTAPYDAAGFELRIKQAQNDLDRLTKQAEQVRQQARANIQLGRSPTADDPTVARAQARNRANQYRKTLETIETERTNLALQIKNYPSTKRRLADLEKRLATVNRMEQSYLRKIYGIKQEEAKKSPRVTVMGRPRSPLLPAKPRLHLFLLTGLALGILIGAVWNYAIDSRTRPIHTLGQLSALTAAPIYRVIPEFSSPDVRPGQPAPEVFVRLLGHYQSSTVRPYRLGVLGLVPDSGVTTTARNLVEAARQEGYHASLDADRTETDLVVHDLPTGASPEEVLKHQPALHEVLLLVRAGHVTNREFADYQKRLRRNGGPLITVVFSRFGASQATKTAEVAETSSIRSA